MPKINPIQVSARGPSDVSFRHDYETHVLADGTFQTLVPEDQIVAIKAILSSPGVPTIRDQPTVRLGQNRALKPALQASDLSHIRSVLEAHGKAMVETEKETDLVIVYRFTANVSYVTNSEGEVFASGFRTPNDFKWRGSGQSAHNAGVDGQSYAVGVSARVVRRVVHVHTATGAFHTETDRIQDGDLGPYGIALNEFVNTPFPSPAFWSTEEKGQPRHAPTKPSDTRIMPYTEENAAFFVGMMSKLCQMAEALRLFFGDDAEHLASSIASRRALTGLPFPPDRIETSTENVE